MNPELQFPAVMGRHEKNRVPNCASWSALRRWLMWSRQKHNHFDRWLAPPGSVFKKLKVFLWDCLRFQEAWALFLSAIVAAEVRCHLLCYKLPFLKWKPVETAPKPSQHGPVGSWIPFHPSLLLVCSLALWVNAINFIPSRSIITLYWASLGIPSRIMEHRLYFLFFLWNCPVIK